MFQSIGFYFEWCSVYIIVRCCPNFPKVLSSLFPAHRSRKTSCGRRGLRTKSGANSSPARYRAGVGWRGTDCPAGRRQKQAGHGARSVAEFLHQVKQIILWRHNAVRENCLIFMPAAELGQFGLDFRHRGKTGAPGVLLRRSKSAFHSTVSAHRKPHNISALRYGLNAENRRQSVGNS